MKHAARRGFTLVELIIVIIILGILAALAIPQFVTSTEDAKEATVRHNLGIMRNAVDLYFHQHNSTYPGEILSTDGSTVNTTDGARSSSFVDQLTKYSDADGKVSDTMDRTTYPYGPYIRQGIPTNPLNNMATVLATDETGSLTADGTTGWMVSTKTGEVISNMTTGDSATW